MFLFSNGYIINTFYSFIFHAFLQQRRGSRGERGLLLRAHSSTFWRRCSPKLDTRTYSCARRWRWKSIYLSPECRWVNRTSAIFGKWSMWRNILGMGKKFFVYFFFCETPKPKRHFISNTFNVIKRLLCRLNNSWCRLHLHFTWRGVNIKRKKYFMSAL